MNPPDPLTPQLPHFLSNFPDETHSDIGVPGGPSVPCTCTEMGEVMDDLVFDDLEERDGHFYRKFSDVPFTGETTGRLQGTFKDGKRDGPWFWFYDNGQLGRKGTFKDGRQEGPYVSYHDNGQLDSKVSYKDGKMDGPRVSYHENGQLFFKETYKDGKKHGPWEGYHKDGTVDEKWTGTFKNGVKISD